MALNFLLDFVLHLDAHLQSIVNTYDTWTYALLFLIIFCETGLIFTPFLPGDSLLFAAGTLAALGSLKLSLLFMIVFIAAVLGDFVNYSFGSYIGKKIFRKEESFFFKKEYLFKTEKFYEKYGPKAIIAARFMPIIRTFAPFIAGIGKMNPGKFVAYNIIGGFLWSSLMIFGGFYFGNIPVVKENFSLVILGIIIVSFLPIIKEIILRLFSGKKHTNDKSEYCQETTDKDLPEALEKL